MWLLRHGLKSAHWWLTAFAALFLAGLAAETASLVPEFLADDGRLPVPRPLLLAGGAALFSLLAVAAWRERPEQDGDIGPDGTIPSARRIEIESWLDRRIAPDEARDFIRADDPSDARFLNSFNAWYAEVSGNGDELWYYSTSNESWEQLAGENGFALVRDGRVVEFMMWSEN